MWSNLELPSVICEQIRQDAPSNTELKEYLRYIAGDDSHLFAELLILFQIDAEYNFISISKIFN